MRATSSTLPSAASAQIALPGIAALATLHLGRRAPRFHGVSSAADRLYGVKLSPGSRFWKGDNALGDWPSQMAAWQARVSELARNFLDGRAVPDPLSAETCEYCALTALCRRVERVRYGSTAQQLDDEPSDPETAP